MRNAFHHRRLFQCKSAAITLLAGISLLQDGLRSSWAAKTTIGAATAQSLQEQTLTPADACADFVADGQGSHEHSEEGGRGRGSLDSARSSLAPWTEGDCVDVWGKWTTTLPSSLYRRGSDPHMLRDSAAIMRARGSPCLVEARVKSDGVGSATMRHLAAWIFAEDLGCDWVTPDWGIPPISAGEDHDGDKGASMYCHTAATYAEEQEWQRMQNSSRGEIMEGHGQEQEWQEHIEMNAVGRRCSVVNWLDFFNLRSASVDLPANSSFRIVEVDTSDTQYLENAFEEVKLSEVPNPAWDHLKIDLLGSHSSNFLLTLDSWDGRKREVVRNILREFRANFHIFPRLWYDEAPECAFEPSRLNFALHVRMGDRRAIERPTLEYFRLLETFMEAIREGVVEKGLNPPMFHVFSETLLPCPTADNATFDEFPVWPVGADQIPTCLMAETPVDCPEKPQGGTRKCRPNNTGVFRVRDKPLLLHVGQDVRNAMSCMIQADGLLMGCSTFGQLAGLLNKDGLSFFSMECSGLGTAVQYKMIPPLAVAEGGFMWVPVSGSWRDPVLSSRGLFSAALDDLLRVKGYST